MNLNTTVYSKNKEKKPMQRCKKEYYSNLLSWKLKIPEIKISARFKIKSQNFKFKI